MVQVGDVVVYVDEVSVEHNALVTERHGEFESSCINLLYISDDETRRDQYGRQIVRVSSVSPQSMTTAPGRYFK